MKNFLQQYKAVLLTFAMMMVAFVQLNAALVTWTGGGVPNDWNDPANWDLGVVPGPADDVVITGSATSVTLMTTANVQSVEIQSGATFIVGATGVLNLANDTGGTTNGALDLSSNSGTIINNGLITVTNAAEDAIDARGTFINNGDIVINGFGNDGVSVEDASGNGGLFTNNGNISITFTGGGDDGIQIDDNGSTFTNNGTVDITSSDCSGDIGVFVDDDAFLVNNATGVINVFDIVDEGLFIDVGSVADNFGLISTANIGICSGSGNHGVEVRGTFNNNTGGTYKDINARGDAIRIEDAGTLNNTGTLIIDITSGVTSDGLQNENVFNGNGGTIEIGCLGTVNELEMNDGDVDFGTSCIIFDILGTGSGGVDFDRLEIRDGLYDVTNAKATLQFDPGYDPMDGDCFQIVNGNSDLTGILVGPFGTIDAPFKFTQELSNSNTDLEICIDCDLVLTTATGTDAFCDGGTEVGGTITVDATSTCPLEISVDGGMTFVPGLTVADLPGGTYDIIVQQVGFSGCNETAQVTIADAPECCDLLLTNVASTDPFCTGGTLNPGTITISATTSGTPEFSIDGGMTFQPSNMFGGLTSGTYNIVVQNVGQPTCSATGMATIATAPMCVGAAVTNSADVADPCTCNDDQTANGAGDGTFSETVTVTSNPGEMWTVAAVSTPGGGTAPTVAVGSVLTDNGDGTYEITFNHTDLQGYIITITNGPETLTIGNVCAYPVAEITVPAMLCNAPTPDTPGAITVSETSGQGIASSTFTVNGMTVTDIDPATLPHGSFTVSAAISFVPGSGGGPSTGSGTIISPATPLGACPVIVEGIVDIIDCSPVTSCDCTMANPLNINAQIPNGLGGGAMNTYTLLDAAGAVIATNTTGAFPGLPSIDASGAVIAYTVETTNASGTTSTPISFDCACPVPSVTIDKDDNDDLDDVQTIVAGNDAEFSITITNDGTDDLCNIVISDPTTVSCEQTFTTIAAGATETFVCVATNVTSSFTNEITITAEGCVTGTMVTATDATMVVVEDCPEIIVEARPVCSSISGTFDIEITSILGGDSGARFFTFDDGTNVVRVDRNTVPNTLTGFTYTGQNDKITFTVADENNPDNCNTTYEVLQLNCQDASSCACDVYNIFAQGVGNGNNFSMYYVLVDPAGTILDANEEGAFPGLPHEVVYTVHALNVADDDLATAIGLFTAGGNYASIIAGTDFNNLCAATTCQANFTDSCPVPTCEATPDVTVCLGEEVTIGVTTDGTNIMWTGPNGFTSTEATTTLTLADLPTAGTFTYTAEIVEEECSSTCMTTVTVLDAPTATISGGASEVCEGDEICFTASPNGGIPPFVHTWAIIGGTGTATIGANGTTEICFTAESAGTVDVQYTAVDGGAGTVGCSATAMVSFTIKTTPDAPPANGETIRVCQFSTDGDYSVMTSCGPCDDGADAEVQWFSDASGANLITTGTTFDPVANGVVDTDIPGMKSAWAKCVCTCPSGNMCMSDATQFSWIVEPTPSIDFDGVTDETCGGEADGTITVGAFSGVPPYVINLLDGAGNVVNSTTGVNPTTFTGLPAGTYSVEVGNLVASTATVVSLDPASAIGFMNIFDLNGGFIFNSGWGVQDLVANFGAGGSVTLAPNQITDPNEFWYQGGRPGEDPNDPNDNGGPGAPGNRIMEALLFNQVTGGLAGQEVSFTMEVTDLDFSCGHTTALFIRDFVADFSSFNQSIVPIPGPGIYTVTLNTSANPTNNVQYGLVTTGVNVWPTDAAACGTLTAQPATAIAVDDFTCGVTLTDIVVEPGAEIAIDDIATTESCDDENVGTATVTATATGTIEYSFDGGPFGLSNMATGLAIGTHTVTVRIAGDVCTTMMPFEILGGVANAPTVVADAAICAGEGLAAPLEASCDEGCGVNWFSEQTGGTFLATGDTYDPIAAGVVSSVIPGVFTFWAECSCTPCTSERVPVMLTVNAFPEPVTIVGSEFVCPSATETYTVEPVDENSSYEWFLNGTSQGGGAQIDITFDVTTESNVITVTETNAAGCSTTSSTNVTVEIDQVLACKSIVVAALGQNCDAQISSAIFVQDNAYPSTSYQIVSVTNDDTGETLTIDEDGTFTVFDKGTFTVMIEHTCSGNTCWSSLVTEDNTAPTIICPDTKFVACDGDLKPVFPDDYPEVADNCCIDADVPETFTFVDSNTIPGETFTGFSGAFGEINWTDEITGGDGTVDFSETALTIVSDDSGAGATETNTSFTFTLGGELSFDWDFFNADIAGFDFAAVTVDAMGVVTDIVPEITDSGSGSVASFAIDAGSTLLISTSSVDGLFGAGTLTITNFSFVTQDTVLDPNDECNGGVYRTWFVTDCCGNVSETCTQLVLRTRPDEVAFPADVNLECSNEENPSTDPEATGFPTIIVDGVAVDIDGKTCSYLATYNDINIPSPCADKIIREWTVFDWCAGEIVGMQDQFITIMDNAAPMITCLDDVEVTSLATECEGTYVIASPEVTDACSNTDIVITLSDGTVVNPGMTITIDESETITYSASDACGNQAVQCTQEITVLDETPPVAICDQNTVVSLTNDGLGLVCAETVDDGSYDNCSDDLIILLKRMDAPNNVPFTECVEFDCEDAGSIVQVRFRVSDGNGTGSGECMVNVTVQDNLGATITCPPNKDLNCDADIAPNEVSPNEADGFPTFYNGEMIGYYPAIDNCGNIEITIEDEGDLDLCGEGTILRTWTAISLSGGSSSSCVQVLTIQKTAIATFTGTDVVGDDDDIAWPADVDLDCTEFQNDSAVTDPANAGEPELIGEEDDCAQLFIGYDDQVLNNDPEACLKILRTWQVIDHCQYDPSNGIFDGFWQHTQLIKVDDQTDPVFDNCEDAIATIDGVDGCEGEVTVTRTAADACDPELTYTWTIVTEGGDTFSGNGSTFTETLEIGTHIVTWTAADNCENVETCTHELKVNDGKQPTPVCIVLYTALMPSAGMVPIWANDFESGSSFDNCTAYEDLNFYVLPVDAAIPEQGTDISDLPTSITFDCSQLGFQNVHMFVEDESGNFDFCLTQVFISDTQCVCPDNPACDPDAMLQVQGIVETEMGEEVDDVEVDISGLASSSFLTGSDGLFNFLNIPTGTSAVVTPEKDMDYLNGVTTFDLVLISQHILGVQELDSPYKIIAADANKSDGVTTLDLVKIQRLILNIDQDFAPNTSWRFVDEEFTFPQMNNPFATPFPEVISLANLTSDEMHADFIGVKIGDVNGSAIPNNLLGSQTRNMNGTLDFEIDEQKMNNGDEYEIEVRSSNFNNMLGYQYTINIEGAEILEVVPGANTTADNFGTTDIANGVITTSWFNANGVSMNDDAVLYTLRLRATTNTNISEVISVSSEVTVAESYTTKGDLQDIAFNFTNGTTTTSTAFELYQNRPNPFKDVTVISYTLPQAGKATLQIMDVSGKILKLIEQDGVQGYNEVQVNKDELSGAGVLYYRLETDGNTATKKMTLIK